MLDTIIKTGMEILLPVKTTTILITLPCKTLYITETASTFQELYGTEEETGRVPQDCDMVFTDYQSRMTLEGERQCEARRLIGLFLRPKDLVNIGNWNVRTMHAFLGCPENTTVPQQLSGRQWAIGKSAAPKPPGAELWRKRGQWRAGSLGRKRELWLRIGTSGRRVVRPYAQQSAKRIGESERL